MKSKIHVQSKDQKENMTFIMDRMSCFYKEVLSSSFMMIANENDSQEGIKVKCNLCGKEGGWTDIRNHIEANHITGIFIPCDLCGKECKSRNAVISHKWRDHRND